MRAVFFGAVFAIFLWTSYGAQAEKSSKLESQKVTLDTVLPVIKSKDYFEAMSKKIKEMKPLAKKFPVLYSKLNDDLYLLYVFDSPKKRHFVTQADLTTLKIKQENLKQVALKNLIAYYKKVRATFRKVQGEDKGQLYYLGAKEAYEASALLLMDQPIWNGQKLELKGKPVIFMPARNVFLVTGDKDKAGLTTAVEMAANFYKNFGHGITPHGFLNAQGGTAWQRLKR